MSAWLKSPARRSVPDTSTSAVTSAPPEGARGAEGDVGPGDERARRLAEQKPRAEPRRPLKTAPFDIDRRERARRELPGARRRSVVRTEGGRLGHREHREGRERVLRPAEPGRAVATYDTQLRGRPRFAEHGPGGGVDQESRCRGPHTRRRPRLRVLDQLHQRARRDQDGRAGCDERRRGRLARDAHHGRRPRRRVIRAPSEPRRGSTDSAAG